MYASKSQKKYKTFQPAKGSLTQVNKEVTIFDRFLLLGIPSSPHVMISFLKNPAATKLNLRFNTHMTPGDLVVVIMPRVISYLSPQNPEVVTSDPIIPVSQNSFPQLYTLPPADVDAPNFTWFDFDTNTVQVFAATAQDNVCTGSFCDAQTTQTTCPCTVSDPHKHWCMCLTFTCDEFKDIARDHVVMVSKKLSRIFISEDKLKWPLTNETIDPFDLDDAVRYLKIRKIFNIMQLTIFTTLENEQLAFRTGQGSCRVHQRASRLQNKGVVQASCH